METTSRRIADGLPEANREETSVDALAVGNQVPGETKPEWVNQPGHYMPKVPDGVECIEGIRSMLGSQGFIDHCRGTIMAYNWRLTSKGKSLEDARKIQRYVGYIIQELERLEQAS